MVLDSRSRTDSIESINGNGASPSSNGNYATVESIDLSTSIHVAPVSKKKSIGQWWQALGLQTKTAVISVAAIAIPLIALGGFAYIYVGQNITESTRQKQAESANGLAYRVAYFMRDRYADIQVLAQLSFLTNAKARDVVSTDEQKKILSTYISSYLVYDSIAVYRLDGSLIVDVSPEPPPANISQRPYFQTVLKTDKPFISQPEPSVVTKKVSVLIAAPVKDSVTWKTIAVIRSIMQASEIEKIIKDFGDGANQYHLSESDKSFFIAKEQEQVGSNLQEDVPSLSSLIKNRELGSIDSIDLFSNNQQLVGYAPLPQLEGLPDLQWDAVVAIDSDIALQPVQQLLLILVGAT